MDKGRLISPPRKLAAWFHSWPGTTWPRPKSRRSGFPKPAGWRFQNACGCKFLIPSRRSFGSIASSISICSTSIDPATSSKIASRSGGESKIRTTPSDRAMTSSAWLARGATNDHFCFRRTDFIRLINGHTGCCATVRPASTWSNRSWRIWASTCAAPCANDQSTSPPPSSAGTPVCPMFRIRAGRSNKPSRDNRD